MADLPPENTDLTFRLIDYSESLSRPGGRSNPPRKHQFEIHINRFPLCKFRQIKWQISLPGNTDLTFRLIDYSESLSRPGGRSSDRPNPPENTDLIFILIDSSSESSGRSSGRSTPYKKGNLRFIMIDSYFESSGRSGGRFTPPQKMQI